MRHGSLFSGIGGFDLAAEWMGWENLFHCELQPFNRRVLEYYWPSADSHTDIKKLNGNKYEGKIDILSGGFPCQPFSAAGKRKGTEDERHLWPEMLRVIREIKPAHIVGENVGGFLTWNDGLVFEQVHADLEAAGYEVQAFVLPACAKDAPHQRDRVWIVAHFNCQFRREHKQKQLRHSKSVSKIDRKRPLTNAKGKRGRKLPNSGKTKRSEASHELPPKQHSIPNWQNFPNVSPIHSRDDGLSARLDGITLSKWRRESIKAAGNAIVPQIAYEIFQAIDKIKK